MKRALVVFLLSLSLLGVSSILAQETETPLIDFLPRDGFLAVNQFTDTNTAMTSYPRLDGEFVGLFEYDAPQDWVGFRIEFDEMTLREDDVFTLTVRGVESEPIPQEAKIEFYAPGANLGEAPVIWTRVILDDVTSDTWSEKQAMIGDFQDYQENVAVDKLVVVFESEYSGIAGQLYIRDVLIKSTAVTPTPTQNVLVTARVTGQTALNLREGPGTNYGVVGAMQTATPHQLCARNEDTSWFELCDGGWVFAPLVRVSGAPETLPVEDVLNLEVATFNNCTSTCTTATGGEIRWYPNPDSLTVTYEDSGESGDSGDTEARLAVANGAWAGYALVINNQDLSAYSRLTFSAWSDVAVNDFKIELVNHDADLHGVAYVDIPANTWTDFSVDLTNLQAVPFFGFLSNLGDVDEIVFVFETAKPGRFYLDNVFLYE